MKAFKGFLITLVVVVALVGVTVIGGYIYVRSAYEIDLFNTAGQLKTLSGQTDEKTLCPNAFSAADMASVKSNIDHYVGGLITYQEGKGYEGYTVVIPPTTPPTSFDDDIVLSSKEAGALAQTVFFQQTGGKIKIGEKELSVRLMQMDFLNVTDSGDADFNIVAKVDLTPLKGGMIGFPYSLFKKYIPDQLYVSSTVKVTRTAENMGYTVSHKELRLNNLSAEDTADLFHTLDAVLKIGSAEELNMKIGTAATNALIGNSENVGFVYSMKQFGKDAFEFSALDDGYIIIYEK